MSVNDYKQQLSGGNRTSVGSAADVVEKVISHPTDLSFIYELFLDDDPVVAMRSSYVAMKVAEQVPESVEPYTDFLFSNFDRFTQQEVRWHVPQLLGHLDLTASQQKTAYTVLMNWTETDNSKIVGYYCLQTAADIVRTNEGLLTDFIPRLRTLNQQGAKSIQNRCKKIAKQLRIEL